MKLAQLAPEQLKLNEMLRNFNVINTPGKKVLFFFFCLLTVLLYKLNK